METQRKQEVRQREEQIAELEAQAITLRASVEAAQQEAARLTQLEQNRLSLQHAAVQQATQQLKENYTRERESLLAIAAAEKERILSDAQSKMQEAVRQNEVEKKTK